MQLRWQMHCERAPWISGGPRPGSSTTCPKRGDRGSSRREDLLFADLAPYLTAAQREVVIISPYFVPGRRGSDALRKLSKGGVRVRVLTNSLASNDVPAVHAGYARYRRELLRSGVELYEVNEAIRVDKSRLFYWLPELHKSALHAKSMVFDRETMFVGSFNFDRRSLHINNEIGVVIEDPTVASDAVAFFDAIIDDVALRVSLVRGQRRRESLEWAGRESGRRVVYRSEPHAGWGLRAAVAALRGVAHRVAALVVVSTEPRGAFRYKARAHAVTE